MGRTDKIDAFKRLEAQVKNLEQNATGPSLDHIIDDEWNQSSQRGGMTVLGPANSRVRKKVQGKSRQNPKQLKLFA
jgi:hypothetical protein